MRTEFKSWLYDTTSALIVVDIMAQGVRAAAVAALLALALSLPDTARGANGSENRVVCYYTNWSVYRPGTAKFSPQNINPYLCTHLIYAFGGFTKENSLKPFDKYQDIEKGGYAKFTGLKTYNKQLKTMLAIGGWNEGSSRFSPMVASPERRKELIKNAIKFLRQNHFDGLDLDWEYPSFRDGGKPRDKDNYAQLVQELREEFDRESQKTGRPRLLLTMAVPAGLEYIDKGYDIPKLNQYLDWMNILSYDYHSAFEPAVNHHSPLYSLEESEDDEYNFDSDLNIDATIKHYLKAGVDRDKLVLGIPTYGRSYTLFNPDANEIGAPADGPGDMGDATRENGYLAYYEICENVKNNEWKVIQPNPRAMGPYAYKGNQWVGYDDDLIVRRKAEYVAQMGLGGIMFWALDNDDFRGVCHGKPYPLIEAGKEALMAAATDNLVDKKAIGPSRTRTGTRETTTVRSSPVRNSGGRQGVAEEDVTKPQRNRKRIRPANKDNRNTVQQKPRTGNRRRARPTTAATTPTTTSVLTQRTSTTPEPPTTPDPGSDFKCEDEGFFPHPRDCKKYFWCLSSGPSELGIIAHQFTCPSGLYFNKAADSCDYTQNVLCNKKLKKSSTTTTTTTTTEPSTKPATTTTEYSVPIFSTRIVPPKITAATSRTTYIFTPSTSTTEAPEYDEYEYEDEDLENGKDEEIDSEEDPRVIKELIELIKKVGGVEQLEKYLQLQEDGTSTSKSDFTTPATISKSLYERVLSQSGGSTNSLLSNLANRNANRGRPQYTTISRNRPQGPAVEEKDFEEETSQSTARETATRGGSPEYVTIRRQRVSTTTSAPGELEYVTLNRQSNRQFQEETTTSRYTTIIRRRPTTESSDLETIEDIKEKPTDEIIEDLRRRVPVDNQDDKEILAVSVQLPSVAGSLSTISTVSEQPTSTASSVTEKLSTPQLFRPRPFTRPRITKPSVATTTTEQTPTTRKVSVVGNRGNSRFTATAQTVRPTDSPNYDQEEYYDDTDPVNRPYRPQEIADLSSLTSADIAFGQGNARRGIKRRPTTTSTTTTTEKTLPNFKTSARTIPLARKTLLASLENTQTARRLPRPITTERSFQRPTFRQIAAREENLEESSRQYQTIVRAKYGVQADSTLEPQLENEVTETSIPEDSTGFDTDNDYKTAQPELTTETTTEEPTSRPRRIIKRIRTTAIPQTTEKDDEIAATTEFNRVRRIRPIKISSRDETDEIKLSETSIRDGTRVGINSLQDQEANKQRKRKKIIRYVRPGSLINENGESRSEDNRKVVIRSRGGRFQLPGATNAVEENEKIVRINQNVEGIPIKELGEERPQRQRVVKVKVRPTSATTVTTTTEVDESDEFTTFDSNYVTEPEEATSVEHETEEDISEGTTEDITTTTTTTTTTSRPRSTAPPLIGRSRPAYTPRGRTPTTPFVRPTTQSTIIYTRRNNSRFKITSTTTEATSTSQSTTPSTTTVVTETIPEEFITTEKEVTTQQAKTYEEKDLDSLIFEEETTANILTTLQDKEEEKTTVTPLREETDTTINDITTVVPNYEKSEERTEAPDEEDVITKVDIDNKKTEVETNEGTERVSTEFTQETTPSTRGTTAVNRLRFKPGDRPRIRFNPNRPQEEQTSTTTEENKSRSRFIASRTDQRTRFPQRGNVPNVHEATSRASIRKFTPQSRKLEPQKTDETDYESDDLESDEEIDSDVPVNEVGQKDETVVKRPNIPAPSRVPPRNFTKKLSNKPVYATTTTTTTTTTTIQPDLLSARNKQLFSNPRKMNIPHKEVTSTPESTIPVDVTVTEEPSTSTEQLSTLHHVFAEIEPVTASSGEPITTSEIETTTDSSLLSSNHVTKPVERLVEVNRIVEVSLKEDRGRKNVSGVLVTEPSKLQVFNAKLGKIGAISRLTVINVVDGSGSANHATLEDILTGRKIFSSAKSNITAEEVSTTMPNDSETRLNILNNTLEIIEADKKFEIFSKSNVVDYSHKVNDPIASAVPKEGAAPIIDTAGGIGTSETGEKANNVEEDLLESANSGRVRVRIVGKEPHYAPIVADNQESATLKAVVVEVPQKQDEIKIAPIRVSIGP